MIGSLINSVVSAAAVIGRGMTVDLVSARDTRSALLASGKMLTFFLAFHALGNSTVLAGKWAINLYGWTLHEVMGNVVFVLDKYFLAGFIVHGLSGLYLAYNTGKFKQMLTNPTKPGAAILTSALVFVAFLVVHLQQFRFGGYAATTVTDPFTGEAAHANDIGEKITTLFKEPSNVAIYVAGAWAIALHNYSGWKRIQSKDKKSVSVCHPPPIPHTSTPPPPHRILF